MNLGLTRFSIAGFVTSFVRPHIGLEGKTLAEAAGIEVKGDNKWLTLIQNAAKSD